MGIRRPDRVRDRSGLCQLFSLFYFVLLFLHQFPLSSRAMDQNKKDFRFPRVTLNLVAKNSNFPLEFFRRQIQKQCRIQISTWVFLLKH